MQNYERSPEAIDASPERRPGVPAQRSPAPVGNTHWLEPDKQPAHPGVIKDSSRPELTATFGTGQVPRGLSGLIRRAAYRLPDYEAKRWAILLIADRVDSLEDRLRRASANPAVWLGALAALGLALGASRSRRMAKSAVAR
jgi:hypothetical protein